MLSDKLTMRACVLARNGKLDLVHLPITAPAADECQIAVHAVGVCSSDISRSFSGGAHVYPLVMGHEFSGRIVQCGDAVADRWRPGEAVAVFPLLPCFDCEACQAEEYARCGHYDYYGSRRHGAYAQYLNVKTWNLLRVPSPVDLDDAALCEPLSVVIHAVNRLGVSGSASTPRIAVLGAGFLGLLAVEVLRRKHAGARIVIMDRNVQKLTHAKGVADELVELDGEAQWDEWVAANRGSFHYVLEAVGAPLTFRNALEIIAPGGSVVWMGNISGDLTLPMKLVSSVLRKEARVIGTWNSGYRGSMPSDWTEALDLIGGGLRPSRYVSSVVSLGDLPEILFQLYQHKSRKVNHPVIKILVRP